MAMAAAPHSLAPRCATNGTRRAAIQPASRSSSAGEVSRALPVYEAQAATSPTAARHKRRN